MLGARVWSLSIDKDKLPTLESFIAPYTWETSVAGQPLPYMLKTDGRSKFWDEDSQSWLFIVEGGGYNPNLGFYAFTDLPTLENELWDFELYDIVGSVLGVVNGYGKIHKHSLGFRSEYQQVMAICDNVTKCSFTYCENPGNFYIAGYQYDSMHQVVHVYCSDCFNTNRGEVKDNIKFISKGKYMQYGHDKFFKDLSKKYDVSLINYEELRGMMES